jgi:thiol-disulfide isomerase/thioredoxin
MLKTLALDFLTGLVALAVIIAAAATFWAVGSDLRIFVLVTGAVFLASGFVRGAGTRGAFWARGLALAAGGSLPVIILSETGIAFTIPVWPAAFACASVLLGICGVFARRLWKLGKRSAGTLTALVTFAGAAIAAFVLIPQLITNASTKHVNRVVEPFSISILDGKLETSAELKGRVSILAFWATWCKPCLAEYPALQDIYASFEGNSEVAFVAVNAGGEADTDAKVRAFIGSKRWTVPVAMDQRESTMSALGLSGLPSLAVLDKAGRLRMVHSGYDAAENLASNVRRVVNKLRAE